MALGDRAEAYDFSLFEDHGHASAAVRKPQQEPAVQPKGKILAFPDAHPVHRNKGKVLRAVTRVLFAAGCAHVFPMCIADAAHNLI